MLIVTGLLVRITFGLKKDASCSNAFFSCLRCSADRCSYPLSSLEVALSLLPHSMQCFSCGRLTAPEVAAYHLLLHIDRVSSLDCRQSSTQVCRHACCSSSTVASTPGSGLCFGTLSTSKCKCSSCHCQSSSPVSMTSSSSSSASKALQVGCVATHRDTRSAAVL